MPTTQEVLDYLGYDYTDESVNRNIDRLIRTAKAWLGGAINTIDESDPRIKELALIVISDLYDNQGVPERVSTNTRRLVADMIFQLQMETRKGEEGTT